MVSYKPDGKERFVFVKSIRMERPDKRMNKHQVSSKAKMKGRRVRHKGRLLRHGAAALLILAAAGLLTVAGWRVLDKRRAVPAGETTVSQGNTAPKTESETSSGQAVMTVGAEVATPRLLVYDLTRSETMYSRNADEKASPASLTKLMTAIVATKYCDANEEFTVGTELELLQPESSRAYIYPGYRLTRDMIIDALLIPSGNDAAYTIAAHVGRKAAGDSSLNDFEAILRFVDLMNEEAQRIGAASTHFSNPDGYYSPDHYTTAHDMLLIGRDALSYENIKSSVAKPTAEYTLLSGQKLTLVNTNFLIQSRSKYYLPEATGMKTGSTDEAGYCLVASAAKDGEEILMVMMGSQTDEARWADAASLFRSAFAAEKAR